MATDSPRALPGSDITVGQLLERWVEQRPSWEQRSPANPTPPGPHPQSRHPDDRRHSARQAGPADIDQMHRAWRTYGMAGSTVKRMHSIIHAALKQAMRWDLIASDPADRIEPPRPAKKRRHAPSDEVLTKLLAEQTQAASGDETSTKQ